MDIYLKKTLILYMRYIYRNSAGSEAGRVTKLNLKFWPLWTLWPLEFFRDPPEL